jgi:hypothetical protein
MVRTAAASMARVTHRYQEVQRRTWCSSRPVRSHHERPRPAPRLHPAETGPGTGHQLIEHPRPADGVYAVASGHQKIPTCHHTPG